MLLSSALDIRDTPYNSHFLSFYTLYDDINFKSIRLVKHIICIQKHIRFGRESNLPLIAVVANVDCVRPHPPDDI
jgi:hypothetical protein